MSGPVFGSSSPRERFKNGWNNNHGSLSTHPKYPDGHWDPVKQQWFAYAASAFRLEDARLPAIDLRFVLDTGKVFDDFQQQWSTHSARFKSLIWNPRNGEWRVPISVGPGGAKDYEKLREALAECDRKRDANLFRPGKYERCRDLAFTEYG